MEIIYLVRAHDKTGRYDHWLVRASSAWEARKMVQDRALSDWGHNYWHGCKVMRALMPGEEMNLILQSYKE